MTSSSEQMTVPLEAPRKVIERRDSIVGQATSEEKLNGQVYTPLHVAQGILDRMGWPTCGPGQRLLDPSCGEGVFLEAALRKLARAGLPSSRSKEIIDKEIVGWDISDGALRTARERVLAVSYELGFGGAVPRIEHWDSLWSTSERFHFVVGNPPYLEAKRMPDSLKSRVKNACPLSSVGAFDLYCAFIERCFQMLVAGGELGFIIPNRFLVVSYATELRNMLLRSSQLRVVDLSTENVFEDAAVYPIVIVINKSGPPKYVVEDWDTPSRGVEIPVRAITDKLDGIMPLPPGSEGGRSLLRRVLADERFIPLSRVVSTRWCVSFHRAGLRDQFTFPEMPVNRVSARHFLGGGRFSGNREVEPFSISWGGWWIDYDEERAKSIQNPLPPASIFLPPKVVVCQNARRSRVALDTTGYILKDTFLSIRCLDGVEPESGWLEWITIVLNSNLFHYLYEHIYGGTRKGGGFLHFLPRYLDLFPFVPPPSPAMVKSIHTALCQREIPAAEAERFVEGAWGVTDLEREALHRYPYPES